MYRRPRAWISCARSYSPFKKRMTLAYLYLVIHAPPARNGAAGVLPCLWMSQSVKELFFQLPRERSPEKRVQR